MSLDHALNVAKYLEANNVARFQASSGWRLTLYGKDSTYSGPQVLVAQTGGLPREVLEGGDVGVGLPEVQVAILGKNDAAAARDKAWEVYQLLHPKTTFAMNGVTYAGCEALQSPIWLGFTGDGGAEWSINFRLWEL